MEALLLQYCLWLFLSGAIISLITTKLSKSLSIVLSGIIGAVASAFGILSSGLTILNHTSFQLELPSLFTPITTSNLVIDPFAAFFIFLICLGCLPVSIYSIGYLRSEYLHKSVGILGTLFHLFILSMLMVICASNIFLFLISWESMALISFCLVISNIQSDTSRKAGGLYLTMTHAGTAFLFIMFLLLAQQTGQLTFDSFQHASTHLSIVLKTILFGCALIGFGAKAGLIPLHIWLPKAHPTAPSHISALMSAVMLKTAIYGFLRCVFYFISPFPQWWGFLVVIIALLSALLGIIYACLENDLKKLLAYSSIENMGIIFFAIGLAMIFQANHQPLWANTFLVAGLLHCLNHSVFKNLLFMTAGSILSVTHTRSLEKLGGLIHKMPITAIGFLVGALAISGIPPLNGFLSEWLMFQGVILSSQNATEFLRIFLPLSVAVLGTVGALAAGTFVKGFSGAFLAMPRSEHPHHAKEVSISFIIGMMIPATLCLIIGLIPTVSIPIISNITQEILTSNHNHLPLHAFDSLILNNFTNYSPILVFVILLGVFALVWFLSKCIGNQSETRRTITWSCGVTPASEFEYTPTGFSQPLRVVFSKLHATVNAYQNYFYTPIVKGVLKVSKRLNVIQTGKIQIYLAYILVTLILCLVWIRL